MGIERPVNDNAKEEVPVAKEWKMNDAIGEIGATEGRVMQMGANDIEPSAFALIRSRVINSELSPTDGVKEAHAIEKGKLDYH